MFRAHIVIVSDPLILLSTMWYQQECEGDVGLHLAHLEKWDW